MGLEKLSSNVWSHYLKIYVWLEGRALYLLRKFYKISAWLGLYFPIRFIVSVAAGFYPRPYNTLVLEAIILVIYIAVATCVNLSIDKSYLPKE